MISISLLIVGCSSDDDDNKGESDARKEDSNQEERIKKCDDCKLLEVEGVKLYLDGTVDIKWENTSNAWGVILKYSVDDQDKEEITDELEISLENTPQKMEYTTLYVNDGDTLFSDAKEIETKGILYNGFPEGFEKSSVPKKDYAQMDVELVSGNWNMDYWMRGSAGAERKNGDYAARSYRSHGADGTTDQSSILELLDNLPYGVSKLEFEHGIVSSDAESTFIVEATTDDGESWEAITDTLYNTEPKLVKKVFDDLNYKENTRIRFYYFSGDELGIDVEDKEGRMNIDDIYIYAN